MGAQGITTIDFGVFPGKTSASGSITGQSSILTTSLVEAWLVPSGTVDHTSDEHLAEGSNIRLQAGNIVAGTGFTIYANALDNPGTGISDGAGRIQKDGYLLYGLWSVAWVWN